MNTTSRSISRLHLLLPLIAVLLQPVATGGTDLRRAVLLPQPLAQEIAEQGNRALLQIRAESRLSLRQLNLPLVIATDNHQDGLQAIR